MPIYEYRCEDCRKVSEFQMKLADPHPSECPLCGHKDLTKIMSVPAFQLKGGGWYADAYDSKSNKKPETGKADAPAPAPAAESKAPAAPSAPVSTGGSSGSSNSGS